ncbi:hypothetical protein, partial [Photorhabdus laumondii]|uniref:hypothetical protein n=1 Tax=Photorhabdus laumondii TaxID=2218628 RepID=UPI000A84F800
NGERRTENGERRTENGERRTENGERRTENGEQKTENISISSQKKDQSYRNILLILKANYHHII